MCHEPMNVVVTCAYSNMATGVQCKLDVCGVMACCYM